MDILSDAREEADRRWPHVDDDYREGFVDGAQWQASRPIVAPMVNADDFSGYPEPTNDELIAYLRIPYNSSWPLRELAANRLEALLRENEQLRARTGA